MSREPKTLSFDPVKYEFYQKYCKETGRKLSPLMEIAMDEYIRNNPIDLK